jgi:fumarate reductase flavoprotein subunit
MKKLETDIVVISAGTAGLAAAVAAAENGARVIAFEKAAVTGGTGNMGMGPLAVESHIQKVKNVNLSREQAFNIFMEYTHWRVDARLVSEYINKSASTIEWLEDMGVEFLDAIAYVKGSNFTHHIVKGASGRSGPQASAVIMKCMTERASELGVKIYLQTPVKKIHKENGRITGVTAEDKNGETIEVKAKAVIVASGGFGDNPEWIKKYTGYEWGKDLFSIRIPGLVGDGIRMAWEVGAGAEGMNMELTGGMPMRSIEENQKAILTGAVAALSVFSQPNLLVNLHGERFMNEEAAGNPTFAGNAFARQPKRCGFKIFDESIANDYEKNGFDWLNVMMPMAKVKNLVNQLVEASKENEHIFVANSLDELASKTGINPVGLKKTVEEYNKTCENGRDRIFHKNATYLKPIKQPRFFAGRNFPSAYGSLGGIKINWKTEVVTQKQEAIPGLYAAGVDANAIYADSYVFTLPGNTMGFALNSGRMAGENAADYAKSLGK